MSHSKKILIYFLFVFSLLVGLFFGENSSGGSKKDFNILIPYIEAFGRNFEQALFLYLDNAATIIHSPVHYILLGNLNNLFGNIFITKIFYIFFSSILPIIFFFILKKKTTKNSSGLFVFSLIIFLSPYFRSSSIWITGDNLALIFFSVSVLFYLKFLKNSNKKKIDLFLCITFLILCSYIRYYYAPFILFYFYEFNKFLNFKWKFTVLVYCFLISLPAFGYFYYIFENTIFLNRAINYTGLSYPSNFFLILSILLFYLFPFFVFKFKKIFEYYKKNYDVLIKIFLLLTFFILVDFFLKNNLIYFSIYGGGVFKKLFELTNINIKFAMYIFSILSLTLIDYSFKDYRKKNYLLLFIFLISFPMYTIYQKYFDPLFYFVFFGLVNFKNFDEIIDFNTKKLSAIYTYFLFFLIFCMFYY